MELYYLFKVEDSTVRWIFISNRLNSWICFTKKKMSLYISLIFRENECKIFFCLSVLLQDKVHLSPLHACLNQVTLIRVEFRILINSVDCFCIKWTCILKFLQFFETISWPYEPNTNQGHQFWVLLKILLSFFKLFLN